MKYVVVLAFSLLGVTSQAMASNSSYTERRTQVGHEYRHIDPGKRALMRAMLRKPPPPPPPSEYGKVRRIYRTAGGVRG
jgi:hypothetical protein